MLEEWINNSRLRWQPSRRAVIAIAVLVAVVAAASLAWVLSSRPQTLTVQDAASSAPAAPSASVAAQSTGGVAAGGEVLVDVAGKVRHPGLYKLRAGARINDALVAAGGVLPGVSTLSLNLAAKVSDGQQIIVGPAAGAVGATGAVGAAGGSANGGSTVASGSGSGTVDINSADLTALESLPGVGPVLAQHILDWRNTHGSFTSVDQLREVSGIGPTKFAELKDLVSL